ncbi:MAG: hypothetical protein JWO38_7685 [Gemmataceae bacterium]|nr:hypothetical protein [Gemmataceae bacterium]
MTNVTDAPSTMPDPVVPVVQDYPGCLNLKCATCWEPLVFAGVAVDVIVKPVPGELGSSYPVRIAYRGRCGCVREIQGTAGCLVYVRETAPHGGRKADPGA